MNLPSHQRIPWGNLAWTMPLLYVFWDPFVNRAAWPEWVLTGLALCFALALFLATFVYSERRKTVGGICLALLLLGASFLAYRPSGGLYFAMAAAFAPLALGGQVLASLIATGTIAILFAAQWWWLHPERVGSSLYPLLVLAEILVLGAGVALSIRQQREVHRTNKTDERERIARDLHDVLGHSLSSMALKAELARRMFNTHPDRALQEICDVERIARQGLHDVREAISGYHAGDIQEEIDRLQTLLRGADVRVECSCDAIDLSPALQRVLALILREAVTNVLRHSDASFCRLALSKHEDSYQLVISDDGRGGPHNEGIGMRSIRTRAEALGGRAEWTSEQGTCVRVRIPAGGVV